jgi:G:T/U-mismatch repair DNA glycosylase
MSEENILSQIDAELEKLTKARALLAAAGRVDLKKVAAVKAAAKPKRKRVLSAEARKRIADAQRKRWAAQKSKNK